MKDKYTEVSLGAVEDMDLNESGQLTEMTTSYHMWAAMFISSLLHIFAIATVFPTEGVISLPVLSDLNPAAL